MEVLNNWQAQANTPRSNLLILNKHLGYCFVVSYIIALAIAILSCLGVYS